MKVRWDFRAVQDLHAIRRYVAAHGSPDSAERIRKYVVARVDRLRSHPRLGVPSDNPDVRILAPTRYPYRIYYTVRGQEVVILHIRHTARAAPDDLAP
jgi:plasmid stabilization system protein ParE